MGSRFECKKIFPSLSPTFLHGFHPRATFWFGRCRWPKPLAWKPNLLQLIFRWLKIQRSLNCGEPIAFVGPLPIHRVPTGISCFLPDGLEGIACSRARQSIDVATACWVLHRATVMKSQCVKPGIFRLTPGKCCFP